MFFTVFTEFEVELQTCQQHLAALLSVTALSGPGHQSSSRTTAGKSFTVRRKVISLIQTGQTDVFFLISVTKGKRQKNKNKKGNNCYICSVSWYVYFKCMNAYLIDSFSFTLSDLIPDIIIISSRNKP